jgi:hypothetical protein
MRRIGFEGILLWGAAGATAATPLTIARDVSYKFDPTKGDTSDRGSIIDYDRVCGVKFSLDFEVNNDDSNAFVAAVRAAAAAGSTIAFRTRDKAAGWGCDGDFTFSLDESQPLRDRQAIKVSVTPNNDTRNITWS